MLILMVKVVCWDFVVVCSGSGMFQWYVVVVCCT